MYIIPEVKTLIQGCLVSKSFGHVYLIFKGQMVSTNV